MNRSEILCSSPFKLHIVLAGVPKATNEVLGAHYWVKHNNATKWKQLMALAIGYKKPNRPLEKAKLTLVRHSWRMLDFDGCVASFKPAIDGLVECGVLVDDRYSVTGNWNCTQEFRSKKLGSMIEVTVEEIA